MTNPNQSHNNDKKKKKKEETFEMSKPNSPASMLERTKRGRVHKKVIKKMPDFKTIDCEKDAGLEPMPSMFFPAIADRRSRCFFFFGLWLAALWVIVLLFKIFSPIAFIDLLAYLLNDPEEAETNQNCTQNKNFTETDFW